MENEKVVAEQQEVNQSNMTTRQGENKKTRERWKLGYKIFREAVFLLTCASVTSVSLIVLMGGFNF